MTYSARGLQSDIVGRFRRRCTESSHDSLICGSSVSVVVHRNNPQTVFRINRKTCEVILCTLRFDTVLFRGGGLKKRQVRPKKLNFQFSTTHFHVIHLISQ